MPHGRDFCNTKMADFTVVLKESEQVIKQCFENYSLDEVFLSFNGGKDCTVLLDMIINVLRDIYKSADISKNLKVIYIRTNNPFIEIEDFVNTVQNHYGITLLTIDGDMKTALETILNKDNRLKACLMGTRRADPHGADLNFMQETDAGWPPMMRVSPLLNWSYHQIWSYIQARQVPYCHLYDKGYTSIGSTLNTWPNPNLVFKDSSGQTSYLPAWKLQDDSQERAGRKFNGHSHGNGHDHEQIIYSAGTNSHSHWDVHVNGCIKNEIKKEVPSHSRTN